MSRSPLSPPVVEAFLNGDDVETLALRVADGRIAAARKVSEFLDLRDELPLARAGVEEAIRAALRERVAD